MPTTLTLKNVPDETYQRLKAAAEMPAASTTKPLCAWSRCCCQAGLTRANGVLAHAPYLARPRSPNAALGVPG